MNPKSNSDDVPTTIHRVHTTGNLQADDYITAKQLTPSAVDRLYRKKKNNGHHRRYFGGTAIPRTTTEEEHSTAAHSGFYGAYAKVRQKLDYSYHVYYRKERQWLHDAIIEDCLLKHQLLDEQQQPQSNQKQQSNQQQQQQRYDYHQGKPVLLPQYPWLICMVGVHGAAKHCTVRKLLDGGRLPLLSLVCVDTDDLRRYLPEYATYARTDPTSVDRRTRKETGYVSETLTLAALQAGRNVVFYASCKDTTWYRRRWIPFLRYHCHGLRVALLHVTAAPEVALGRARQRARALRQADGLDEQAFLRQLTLKIPRACRELRHVVDYYGEIRNNPGDRDLDLLVGGADWSTFTQTFDQRGHVLSRVYPDDNCNKATMPPPPVVHTHRQRVSTIPTFSTLESSEDNHAADDMEFYGPFASIRRTLDYSYHKNYTFERQHFQDAIIREFLNGATGEEGSIPSRPWAVFTAGAMGAGKGYTIDYLVKKGRFPLMSFVKVNSDEIRRYLPEYHLYVETNADLAGDLTNKEAGYIAEILALAGLQNGKNILVDSSLRRAAWYRDYFARLRCEFSGLRLAILHVTAPREAIFQRASQRALETGRIVPRELIIETIEQVPKSVAELRPLVDYHIELRNDPKTPDIEIVTPGETWEHFTSQWVQTSFQSTPGQHPASLPERSSALKSTDSSDQKKTFTGRSNNALLSLSQV